MFVVRYKTKPPKFLCRICQTPFHDGESAAYERHVIGCYDRNEQELREASLRIKMPALFGDEAGDPELERWVRSNRAAIMRGRKKI